MSTSSITSASDQRNLAVPAKKPGQGQDTAPLNPEQTAVSANTKGEAISATAKAKHQLNAQILEASAQVSLQSGNDSQALLFRSAIDHINELLAPELGANAIQGKMDEDNSPEATAQRILSLSTGFFDAYAAQHKESTPEEAAKNFVDLVRGGFEKGFKEATDILGGLKVFDGDIKSGVMKTYELVSKGFDDFLASKLQSASDAKAASTKASE